MRSFRPSTMYRLLMWLRRWRACCKVQHRCCCLRDPNQSSRGVGGGGATSNATVREIGAAPRGVIVVAAMSLAGSAVLVGTGPPVRVIARLAAAIGLRSAVIALKGGVIGLRSAVIALRAEVIGLRAGAIGLTCAVIAPTPAVIVVKAVVIALRRAVIVTKAHRPNANTVTGAASKHSRLIEAADRMTEVVGRAIWVLIHVITAGMNVRSNKRARKSVSTRRTTLTAMCSRWSGWMERITATAQCSLPTMALPATAVLRQAGKATTGLA